MCIGHEPASVSIESCLGLDISQQRLQGQFERLPRLWKWSEGRYRRIVSAVSAFLLCHSAPVLRPLSLATQSRLRLSLSLCRSTRRWAAGREAALQVIEGRLDSEAPCSCTDGEKSLDFSSRRSLLTGWLERISGRARIDVCVFH